MTPQTIFFSRVMRSVVLAFFIVFLLLTASSWVNYLFAATCAVFLGITLYQLWTTHQRERRLDSEGQQDLAS